MRRSPYAFAAVALLCGCIHEEPIWSSVLVHAPFIYLTGLAVLKGLFAPWARALPGLQFGRYEHWATFAALVVLATWAAPGAQLDGFGAIWGCFGGTTLVLWLLICRIGLIWPKSQPFRWSGAAAFALSVSPAVAGLAIPELREFGKAGIFVWLFGSGLGVTPVLTLAVMIWEARRVGRHAERAIAAGEDPARRG